MRISDWSSDVCSSDLYVQHQFEDTYWARNAGWTAAEAALRGSSHYHMPGVLRWLTANIGIHHVHHLASRIPYYRLPRLLRDHPEIDGTSRLPFLHSLGCIRQIGRAHAGTPAPKPPLVCRLLIEQKIHV